MRLKFVPLPLRKELKHPRITQTTDINMFKVDILTRTPLYEVLEVCVNKLANPSSAQLHEIKETATVAVDLLNHPYFSGLT